MYENIIDGLSFIFSSKRTLYFRRWRLDETAATVVLSSEGGGRPQSFTQAAPNERKLGRGGKVVRASHRLGGGVGGETGTGEED